MVLIMYWLYVNSVYIRKIPSLFRPMELPEDVVTTLLEGTINTVNSLFGQEKVFLLILNMNSSEKMNVS